MKLRPARIAAALAGATMLTVALVGCSSPASTDSGEPAAAASGSPDGTFAVDENTLVFGVVPDSVDTETNYQPLMDYVAKKTGKSVEYHESTDYAALIEAAIAGQIDVASFSGFTYVTAANNGAALTPISSIITKEGQEPGYYSQAIVPTGSEITSLDGFAGKKVCFVDPSSTSGYLFPSYKLMEAGVDPETDITPVFAGKHDVSVTKVGEGVECEAGFAEDSEVAQSDMVKVVDETMVPGAPIVMSTTLPDDLRTQLDELLSELTTDQIVEAGIEGADSDGFRSVFYATTPVDDAYYDTIRDICEKTNATQCQG
ncbi:phosphate/phosphite/phosphonate ABC transporter substrate-binding protein [Cryobacterium sp. SO1]|uniref:phosphate/phosphite/phosphonate ABC transporter substrate-binding protein n=1 Tax=Cryobacterium sp. SO1 TaxID=1897061 RepID=UPI001022A9C0|nr:phosphate/phosphite/phosphonate ABC transporter substrate-binding protein [Cryobacterium sp. SO1]RZI34819.1 Phosphate-import protein PhnD [Cryobacterium sp. SO1]